MKKLFTFTILSVLLLSLGFSPDKAKPLSISGVIYDDSDNQLMAFSRIRLFDSSGISVANAVSSIDGSFEFNNLTKGTYSLVVSMLGYDELKVENLAVDEQTGITLELKLKPSEGHLNEVMVVSGVASVHKMSIRGSRKQNAAYGFDYNEMQTETYQTINENGFHAAQSSPLSTFSADVDAASYSNVRRHLVGGKLPTEDAIRVEEMINYFEYDYPNPTDGNPFSITTEFGKCPWNEDNHLVHIGLQGVRIETKDLPQNNLTFLIDVSGSMSSANRLPLIKKSLAMLVDNLNPNDKIAIVVYAGAAGEVLSSTPASQKNKILDALEKLEAGGSTAGGEGIQLAYKIAEKNFSKNGNNRVIICTDGDFNVGASSDNDMQKLIEEKRSSGVFLTCLGYGMGNYKDSKLEILANKGNGNFAYIDNLLEAQKVLITEMGATLVTVAKDVKIQVEFNPKVVKSYRLVGYENRLLQNEDFNDDKKDAGEIGAGHSVTALYEIVLVDSDNKEDLVDPLKYQQSSVDSLSNEILTVKFRYKEPKGSKSKLIVKTLLFDSAENTINSENLNWSASVAMLGMYLRKSPYLINRNSQQIIELAENSKGKDPHGYRSEFIRLVKLAESLTNRTEKNQKNNM